MSIDLYDEEGIAKDKAQLRREPTEKLETLQYCLFHLSWPDCRAYATREVERLLREEAVEPGVAETLLVEWREDEVWQAALFEELRSMVAEELGAR